MSRIHRLLGVVTLCLVVVGVVKGSTVFSLPQNEKPALPSALRPHAGSKATVVVFLSVGCPVANQYVPRLNELAKKYEPRGVKFVGVNANAQDSADAVAKHAKEFKIEFPVVKDASHQIANASGAERTPEAVAIDAQGTIRYRGRIDDQYGVGFRKEKPTRDDLVIAIDELLAGKSVSTPQTEVAGCIIGRDESKATKEVAYSSQVARIIQKRCQSCHNPDGVAPFALMTYEEAKAWAPTLKEVVTAKRMPPWHADPRYGKFTNDRSLTAEEISTLVAWVDAGAPKGSEGDMPLPVQFPQGWRIGEPDRVISMSQEFEVPAAGVLPYQRFTIDPEFKEDVWVERAEAKPGCKAVHHILIFVMEPGKPLYDGTGETTVLCGTAPGDMPTILQPGLAKKIPAGAKLLFEVHYTPIGKAMRDRSSIGLIFAKQPPQHEVKMHSLPNIGIRIPPNESNHREEAFFTFPRAIRVLSLMPHMHLRGKSWEYRLEYPDGRTETLLNVPKYDFNWQSIYRFADPPLVPKGAKLHCIAHWDNSKNNPANPDPNKTIFFGPQTWDEMMMGWMEYVMAEEK